MSSPVSIHWTCSCSSEARYTERQLRRHFKLVHPGKKITGSPYLTLRMNFSDGRHIQRIWSLSETLKVSRHTITPYDSKTLTINS